MTDLDLQNLTERDLLIVAITKLDRIENDYSKLEQRVTDLERAQDTQTGMIRGARYLWEFLRTLPVALVALLLGREM